MEELLKQYPLTKLVFGNRYLVFEIDKWVVYQERSTGRRTLICTDDLSVALRTLKQREDLL